MDHQPLRSTDIRDRNQKLILRLLFQQGAMSQSQVVQKTGLKAPTVFRIFSKLEEDHYIRPCRPPVGDRNGDEGDRKGRRPVYFCVIPTAAFAIGVDFSTAGAAVIVTNFVNEVIHDEYREFAPGINRDDALAVIGSMIGHAMDQSRIAPRDLAGIGIGAPGTVNTEIGVIVDYPRMRGLTGYALKRHFEELLGAPVFVHNNASMIAASEYHYDTARQYRSLLAILVRGGVGAAFISDGRIFLNGSSTALEIGRTAIGTIAAGRVREDALTLEGLVGERPLFERIAAEHDVRTWADVSASVTTGAIETLLTEPANALATAARNLYHVLHPEAVLVISRHEVLARILAGAVGEAVPEAVTIPITYDPVKACYGATDMVFQRFFSDSSDFSLFHATSNRR